MAKRAFSSPREGDAGPGLEKGAPQRTGHLYGVPVLRGGAPYMSGAPRGPGTPDLG
jgi:hypothetical protein